jgi:signal peptidase I
MDRPHPLDAPLAPAKPQPTLWARFWRGWGRDLLFIVAGLLLLRSTVLDWNVVPSGSMRPTIVEGDYILVNKLAFDLKVPFLGAPLLEWGAPARGDIIVFTPPGETERFVKRVVGVPGDVLELRDNQLLVNGLLVAYEPLSAPAYADAPPRPGDRQARELLAGRAHAIQVSPERPSGASFGPLTVPAGHYFVLGDNRDDSKDSRFFGPVARERIAGRVSVVALSLDRARGNLPRWHRFFHGLS